MQYIYTQEEHDKVKSDREYVDKRLAEIKKEVDLKYKKAITDVLNKYKIPFNDRIYHPDLEVLLTAFKTTFNNDVIDWTEYQTPIIPPPIS